MFKQEFASDKIFSRAIIGFCLLLCILIVPQATKANTLETGKTLLLQGKNLNRRYVPDSAYLAYSKAVAIFKDKSPSGYISARIGQAEALLQMKAIFNCYQQLREDELFLKKHFKPLSEEFRLFYRLKGEMHFQNREVENALAAWYMSRQIAMKQHGLKSMITAMSYFDLGKCYLAGGRTDSSYIYATKALQILNAQPAPLKTEGAPLIYALYGVHFRSMQYDSDKVNNKAVSHKGKKYPTNAHINLAYQDSSVTAETNLHGKNSQFLAKIYTNIMLALTEVHQGAASTTQRSALAKKMVPIMDKGIKIYELQNNPERAYLQACMASLYEEYASLDPKKADQYYLQALKSCLPDYKGTSFYQYPVINNVQSENHLGVVFEFLGYSFLAKYKNNGQKIKDLEAFYQYALRSLDLADYIRNKKNIYEANSGAPSLLFQGWHNGLAIEAAYLLYKKTGNEKYKDEAFKVAEKFKSINLLQAALNNRLNSSLKTYDKLDTQYKTISAEILREEEKAEIARRFNSLRDKLPFSNSKQELVLGRKKMQDMASETKNSFPEFYSAKINRQFALDQKAAQQQLSDDKTAVISYFLNVNHEFKREAYIFVVQKGRTDMLLTELPENYEYQIDSLVKAITASNLPVYRNYASQYNNLLIKPVKTVLGKQVEKLIIMPDGNLWQIPFETLLTKNVTSSDYRKLPYLLRDFHISYQHSATLNKLSKAGQNQQFTQPILAMAPFADKNLAGQIASGKVNLMSGKLSKGTYAKLPYTIELLHKLQEKVSGLFLIDKEATEESFKANASNFSIIHLATHAETNMEDPLQSKFLMAKGQKEDGELHMSELLNLNIKPNLAVLSACETGIGMIDSKNEGMTSLSWCFYYLGCPSTLSTLWKVDDRQTSAVLGSFYDNLFAGKTKQESLQQAKLDFVSKARTSDEANPFYWSGLVLTGDEGHLVMAPKPLWQRSWFIGAIVGSLLLFLFLMFKRRRSVQLA
jgi:CHAT domain-containing protein